ncbi:MAG TPA: FtsX-like permease family protein [Kofleriaceae bacterium]|nr:FtsX-like permease family protein [Kofleriaceae bacterium]
MQFFPILSTLRRHRTAAILIVLEIAFTCAIVCNAIFLIRDRLSRMDGASGIAEDEVVRVQLTGIGNKADAGALTAQDLTALRAIPGVRYVAAANMVPFGNSSWNTDISTIPDDPSPQINAAMYLGSPDLLETLGVQLIAGRDFTPEEYVEFAAMQSNQAHMPSIILTRGVAERLFPGKSALGQAVYVWGKEPQTVVGVIDQLARPNEGTGAQSSAYAIVLPVNVPFTIGGNYLLRVEQARKAEVLAAVDPALDKVDPSRIILKRQIFAEIRADYFKQDRAMAYLLIGVSLALLVITALGIVGLASFWVQQRTRQIGIRRALGATRSDIVRYFQVENFILATAGIVIGMALAYAINLWLMHKYQVNRLPGEFLPVGAALLWLLGQIAVLGPAMRAALIPPAIATRTV